MRSEFEIRQEIERYRKWLEHMSCEQIKEINNAIQLRNKGLSKK